MNREAPRSTGAAPETHGRFRQRRHESSDLARSLVERHCGHRGWRDGPWFRPVRARARRRRRRPPRPECLHEGCKHSVLGSGEQRDRPSRSGGTCFGCRWRSRQRACRLQAWSTRAWVAPRAFAPGRPPRPFGTGWTFTQTRPCHSLSSSVPAWPGILRCPWLLPGRRASSRRLVMTRPCRWHSASACSAVRLRSGSSTSDPIVLSDMKGW
jgi:hypothetical protein